MASIATKEMGDTQLIFRRVSFALCWSVFVLWVLSAIFLLVTSFDPMHPVLWLSSSLRHLTSWSSLLYIIPLALVGAAQSFAHINPYIEPVPYYSTRFSLAVHVLSAKNFSLLVIYVVSASLFSLVLLTWSGLCPSFIVSSNGIVYNEEHLFFFFGCLWSGIARFGLEYRATASGYRSIRFPVVQQAKLARVKTQFLPKLRSSLSNLFLVNLSFLFLFYFFGQHLRYLASALTGKSVGPDELSSLCPLMSPRRIFHLWFLSILINAAVDTVQFFFNVYLTERKSFPVQKIFGQLSLDEALDGSRYPIVQHLAFEDLRSLSVESKERRSQILALSQPGGHPVVWTAIVLQCLSRINWFAQRMTAAPLYSPYPRSIANPNRFNSPVSARSPILPNRYHYHVGSPTRRNLLIKWRQFSYLFRAWVDSWFNRLVNMPIIHFLFNTRPDVYLCYILTNSCPVIWAVDCLSLLAVASLTEDTYGVVQTDLPQIINGLLKFNEAVSRASQLGCPTEPGRSFLAAHKAASHRALYRIVTVYKPFVYELGLSKESLGALRPFLAFEK